MRSVRCVIFAVILACGACAPAPDVGGFDSANPATKLYAIRDAGATRDRSAIPHLIEQLGSDDPAVRLLAIQALERITGTRMGYNYYDLPSERDKAVRAWVEAYQSGRLDQPTDKDQAVRSD